MAEQCLSETPTVPQGRLNHSKSRSLIARHKKNYRPIGRRNWLFCGSERGARAAAVHFSLIASCHRHGLDAFAYLRDVLTRLPLLGLAPSRDDLRLLLPDRWTKQ